MFGSVPTALTESAAKSRSGRSTLYLPEAVGEMIQAWKKFCPASTLGLVFPTRKGKPMALNNFTRRCGEPLLEAAKLMDPDKGWVMSTGPQAQQQDTTPWYASFWEFCSLYCNDRFGKDWFLSPEQSLLLHVEAPTIPPQVVVNTPKGKNNKIDLLFGTSLYDLAVKEMPEQLTERNSQRVFTVEAALIRVPEGFFQRAPIEMQVAMASVRDVSTVLALLLDGGHSAVAGRLAGAFRRVGRDAFADEIVAAFKAAGYDVRESDPFAGQTCITTIAAGVPPLVARLRAIWESQRETIIEIFPKAPGLPSDKNAYMKFVEDIYESDAYHSLSIEGYSVTPSLSTACAKEAGIRRSMKRTGKTAMRSPRAATISRFRKSKSPWRPSSTARQQEP